MGVRLRGAIWYFVQDVPKDVREHFGGSPQIWESLRTKDKTAAKRLGAARYAAFWDKVDAIREPAETTTATAASPESASVLLDPQTLLAAVDRWKVAVIDECHVAAYNGYDCPYPDLLDSHLTYAFQRYHWPDIDDLEGRLATALRDQGISLTDGHPVLAQVHLRRAFADAWKTAASYAGDFKHQIFGGWTPANRTALDQGHRASAEVTAPHKGSPKVGSPRISEVLDLYIKSEKPKEGDTYRRTYFRRLIEHVGDIPIEEVTPPQLTELRGMLASYPVSKRQDVSEMSLQEAIAWNLASGEPQSLTPQTIRKKWFSSYRAVFDWAVDQEYCSHNRVAKVMPSKEWDQTEDREPYEPNELRAIFSTPLFQGCEVDRREDGTVYGYRKRPGALALKDASYWLPILALYGGYRLHEIGAAPAKDVQVEDGIHFLNLENRNDLKTPFSRRKVRLHPEIIRLGFLNFVDGRLSAGAEMLFDLPPSDDPDDYAKGWGKWFNLWLEGNGVKVPKKAFHTFRHTVRRALREADVTDPIADCVIGHKTPGMGAQYGKGVGLWKRDEAVRKISYPSLPSIS